MENEKKEVTFTQKLLAVQKEILPIKKDLENPFFKSMYFDINAIIANVKPILNKYGLVVEQPIMIENGRNILQTFIKDTESKEATVSSIILPDLQDPQKLGAVISYFRRYSLQSLLFLEAEDTDANDTAPRSPTQRQTVSGAPNCSICGKPMKPTKAGAKNPFWCKHGADWGNPVYPKPPVSKEVEEFNKLFEEKPPYNGKIRLIN